MEYSQCRVGVLIKLTDLNTGSLVWSNSFWYSGLEMQRTIELCLKNGADRVAINSYATENPNFISEAVTHFGSSTIVSYIEAKKNLNGYEVYKYYGREPTGIDLIEWVKIVQDHNCGEIILTSIDNDGIKKGFDFEMIEKVYKSIFVPIVVSGGCGKLEHINDLIKIYPKINIALASCLHYNLINISDIKKSL